jgi:hypothetical protein
MRGSSSSCWRNGSISSTAHALGPTQGARPMPSWKSERRPSIIRKRILRSGCATCTSRGDAAVACAFTPCDRSRATCSRSPGSAPFRFSRPRRACTSSRPPAPIAHSTGSQSESPSPRIPRCARDRPCAAGSTRPGRVAGIDHDRPSLPHRAVSACSRLGARLACKAARSRAGRRLRRHRRQLGHGTG